MYRKVYAELMLYDGKDGIIHSKLASVVIDIYSMKGDFVKDYKLILVKSYDIDLIEKSIDKCLKEKLIVKINVAGFDNYYDINCNIIADIISAIKGKEYMLILLSNIKINRYKTNNAYELKKHVFNKLFGLTFVPDSFEICNKSIRLKL